MNSRVSDLQPIAASICELKSLDLKKPLGQGSFKQAFLVKDTQENSFALKIIRDPNPSPRTQREVDSLQRCNHHSIANLVSVDSHVYQGVEYQYLIEEHLSGGTLSSLIDSKKGLEPVEVVEITVNLASALSHLHRRSLVHRDIKPDNIMFREDKATPVLVDFGCVRDLSASSLTQTWAHRGPGTPYYASPEQLNNQKILIDWRSDQFALGITLFYALFSTHPYQHPGETLLSPVTVERVARRGNRRPDFHEMIGRKEVIQLDQMTAPWPVQRYRFPADLAAAWNE